MGLEILNYFLKKRYEGRGQSIFDLDGRKIVVEGFYAFLKNEDMEKILDSLKFSCKRCGTCCIFDVKPCSHLHEKKNETYCDIYGSNEFPLVCKLYPIKLNEYSSKGELKKLLVPGLEISNNIPRQEVEWIYHLTVEDFIVVEIREKGLCWSSGEKPLKDFFEESLKLIKNYKGERPLNPEVKVIDPEVFWFIRSNLKKDGPAGI